VKGGDIIFAVNGTRTKDLTHVQVVRLVITSGPLVTFCLKRGSKISRRTSNHQSQKIGNVQSTPLQTQHRGSHEVTPPSSPSIRQQHQLPVYYSHHREEADSPSQLPLNSLTLDCLPPPPYTPEVPSQHRMLARGQESSCGGPQDTTYVMKPQLLQGTQNTWQTNPVHDAQGNHFRAGETVIAMETDSEGTDTFDELPESQEDPGQQELLWSCTSNEIMEILPTCAVSGDKENKCGQSPETVLASNYVQEEKNSKKDLPDDRGLLSSNSKSPTHCNGGESFLCQIRKLSKPNPRRVSDSQQESASIDLKIEPSELSQEEETIEVESDYCRSSAKQSPQSVDTRESFLSQIQQFDKAKLKKLSPSPGCKVSDRYLQRRQREFSHKPEELTSEDAKDFWQESIDSETVLSALKQVLQHRARVMHDTLTSMQEFDSYSSNDDTSDDEWDL